MLQHLAPGAGYYGKNKQITKTLWTQIGMLYTPVKVQKRSENTKHKSEGQEIQNRNLLKV